MTDNDARTGVRRQKRSAETRRKIIEAGAKLFSEDGYHATSSKRIAREAGIAVGSFYNYFGDKKELLFEIHRLHAVRVHQMVEESLRSIDLTRPEVSGQVIARSIVGQALTLHTFSPGLHRQITALVYSDPDFARMQQEEEKRVVQMLVGVLKEKSASLRVEDLEAAAWVVAQSVEAVVHAVKIFGPSMEEERLTDSLGDMIHRFLFKE